MVTSPQTPQWNSGIIPRVDALGMTVKSGVSPPPFCGAGCGGFDERPRCGVRGILRGISRRLFLMPNQLKNNTYYISLRRAEAPCVLASLYLQH